MTTEYVLILAIYAFVLLGVFLQHGPIQTFQKSGPRLAAKMEQEISIGNDNSLGGAQTCRYRFCVNGGQTMFKWQDPQGAGQ